ncbi:MAG TPA: PEGA domain-containing protein, partial [Gemmatimonadales bacterium]|nr:PEGA domain-containing protein [Gemmatimonadales bacterium]
GSIAPTRAPVVTLQPDPFAAERLESPVPRAESAAALLPPSPARTTPPARAPVRVDPAPRRTSVQPGRLFINATPWGRVFVDGVLIGNTPQAAVAVAPGTHRLLVVREGFQAFETTLQIASGQELRLTDIVLREVGP